MSQPSGPRQLPILRINCYGIWLHGHLFIHHGDDSAFLAVRQLTAPKSRRKRKAP